MLDLTTIPAPVLVLLAEHIPDWREAIAAECTRRTEHERIWNSARLLAERLRTTMQYRWQVGYSANEEARGIDEQEADAWQTARHRIRRLQCQSLARLQRQQRMRRLR